MATSVGNEISNTELSSKSPQEGSILTDEILVCLPQMVREAREEAISAVMKAFPDRPPLIAVTELNQQEANAIDTRLVGYDEARSQAGWNLHAIDYLAASNTARKHRKPNVLLIGSETPSIVLLQSLARHITQGRADMAFPRFDPEPSSSLVNSGVIYPMTRALYGQDIRFPLPNNIALSERAIVRLASEAQSQVNAGNSESLLWPVSVAATAGLSLIQVDTDDNLPLPQVTDFNRLFIDVVGSLLSEVELRAMNWQRGRYVAPSHQAPAHSLLDSTDLGADVVSMVQGFHVAYANLLPIWSFVLPPQSLLALKKLALMPESSFILSPEVWARIVYDFALSFHLRKINRNHLLGALVPLYLAWAASHLRSSGGNAAEAERRVQETASAFEIEKPYFLSRWRWPDRFNP